MGLDRLLRASELIFDGRGAEALPALVWSLEALGEAV
jgi:hypothetical protein